MKKRLISLLLVVVMLVGMLPALGITINAATDPMSEGMTFTADDEHIIPYALDVGASGDAITLEAEIYLPESYATSRGGVIFGTYGSGSHQMNLEIETNGRVRLFMNKHGQIHFDDDGKRKDGGVTTSSNTVHGTNIFDYMKDGQYVKIAVVVDIAKLEATLYINGEKKTTYPFSNNDGVDIESAQSGYMTTSANFRLGGDYRENNDAYFKGSVKNVALYSDARTGEEMKAGINKDDNDLLFGFDLTREQDPLADLSKNKRHIVAPNSDEINGMNFKQADNYDVPYKLDIATPAEGDEAITFETEIYIPESYYSTSTRCGVILGSYDTIGGTKDVNFEIYHSGCIRFFSEKLGFKQVYFDDDGGAGCGSNTKYNIFNYMTDANGNPKYVKIAIVANITDKTATLYLDGQFQVTYKLETETSGVEIPSGCLKTTNNFQLGGDQRDGNGSYFKGNIRNVALYSYERPANEIGSGIDADNPNLIFGYDLTDKLNPLSDLSANKRHIVEPVDSTLNGMTFTADRLYKIPYKLNVDKPEADEAITFEAEIYINPDYDITKYRSGVILGSYDGADGTKGINFEIAKYGCVRVYTDTEKSSAKQVFFTSDGKENANTTINGVDCNVFNYMTDADGNAQFVKIAIVVNVTDKQASLYINGEHKATKALDIAAAATDKDFLIGGDHRTNNNQNFKGEIKNVTLYSDVRTASELRASGTAATYSVDKTDPNLWCAYDLTNSITAFKDLSANGRDAGGTVTMGTNGGMKFSASNLHQLTNGQLNITGPVGYDEAITIQTEIYIPYSKKSNRNGVVFGAYTDDAKAGSLTTNFNLEVYSNGSIRIYSSHIGEVFFNDNGTKDSANSDITNIFTYMGGENNVKYVKIAVVINITTAKAMLYLDGNKVKEASLSKAGTGDLKLPDYFYLGGDLRIGNAQYFKGNIRNITLYSDVRTDAEIKASGTANKYSVDNTDANLIFAYDFTREGSDTLKDLSSNKYDIMYDPNEGKTFTNADKNEMAKPLPSAPKTFEATIYMPAIELKDAYRGGVIVGNYSNTPSNINFEIDGGGHPKLYYTSAKLNDSGAYIEKSYFFGSVDVRDYNDWIHLVIVYDDVTDPDKPSLKCYVNGVLKETIASCEKYNDDLFTELAKTLYIGRDSRGGNKDIFKGVIKDIALYSDARSADEIASDYANGTVTGEGQDSNLLAAYDFTKVADFKDYSGNGYDIKRQAGEGLTFTQDTLYRTEKAYTAVPYSFETWLYLPKSLTEGRGGVIFGNCTYGGDTKEINTINVEIHGNGNPRFYFNKADNSVASYIFTEVDVRSDNWVHLAIVYDKANKLVHCYLNGELAQTIGGGEVTVASYSSKVAQNSTGMCIGGDMRWLGNANKYNEMYFKGALKELAVYSDVRTAEEIRAAYEQGVNTNDAGLISYYDLDLDEGVATIKDIKGKNNMTADWKYSTSGLDTSKYSYTFAFVGDTQKIVQTDAKNALDDSKADTDYAKQIYQWIADNAEKEKIKYVFGLGDITETGTKMWDSDTTVAALANKEWEIAYNAMQPLRDNNVKYALIAGNHERANHYTASPFANDTFMLNEIDGYYSDGNQKLGNYYINFDVGEHKYTLITLEYGAVDEILKWAGDVADANPDRRVIMTTHAYMFRDGTTLDKGDVVPPDSTGNKAANNGDEMWDKFVSQHANIVLVVSGHDPYENIAWRQDMGVNGNIVSQFLIDPQGMSATTTGMVALFHFSEDGSQIAVEYVSTHRSDDEYNVYYRNQNQFEFNLFVDKDDNVAAEENVYYVTGNADNYTAYYTNGKVANFTELGVLADINGYILSLEGNIGVNSFMDLSAFAKSGAEKLYVKFIVDGEETVIEFSKATLNSNYGYGFKGLVSAAQMTSEIKVELYYGDVLLVSDTTSVAEYAKVILDNEDNLAEYTKAQGIVKAMLNYGAAAQAQFGQNLDNLANSIVTDVTVGNNADKINAAAKSKVSGAIDGVTYRSTTLGLESETALYHFFNVTDTDISKYTVVGADEVVMLGNVLRVKIAGIEAAKLSTEYAVSVTYNGETINVTANAMAYAKAVVNSSAVSDVLKTLMNALYDYNVAMVAYNG